MARSVMSWPSRAHRSWSSVRSGLARRCASSPVGSTCRSPSTACPARPWRWPTGRRWWRSSQRNSTASYRRTSGFRRCMLTPAPERTLHNLSTRNNAMSVTPTITFTNSLPGGTSLVTFTLAGKTGLQLLVFTVSAGGSVKPDLAAFPGPWTVMANIGDDDPTVPTYAIGPSVIDDATTALNVVPSMAGVFDIQEYGTAGQTPATPSRSVAGSIFDAEPVEVAQQLNFAMQQQSQTQWCWCTVAACVGNYYGATIPWTQCQLASWKFPACGDCCAAPLSGGCNSAASVMQALTHVGHLN